MKKYLNINTILILAVLVVGIFGIWYMNSNKVVGNLAIVQVEKNDKKTEINLGVDGIHKLDAALPVTLEVKNGTIAFIESQCPDKLCEGYGYISHEGDVSICLPAGVIVTINEVQ